MEVTDDRGARVRLEGPPRRVVSLVPSATETLFDLGLPVVGVTRFCVHPADRIAGLPKIGGTKDVDVERVRALTPDLIVGNCEENTREIFDALGSVAPPSPATSTARCTTSSASPPSPAPTPPCGSRAPRPPARACARPAGRLRASRR